jgi:WD40 repeat protein
MVSCLVAGIACTSAWAELPPRLQQRDRRDRMFPELLIESDGRRGTCDVLTFTGDGKHLLAAGDDKVVRIWEYRDGQIHPQSMKVLRWAVWRELRGAIYALAVSPNPQGRRVAIGGLGVKTTAAAVINRLTGEVLSTIYANDHPAAPKGHFGSVRAIAYSPRGERIAFGSADGSVWLWRPEGEGKEQLMWLGRHRPPPKKMFNRVRFLHFQNERRLLSVAQSGEVIQWELVAEGAKSHPLKPLEVVGDSIHDVILSPDGRWLAARAMKTPDILVRSFDGERKDIKLEGYDVASGLAFDPSGRRLAVGVRSFVRKTDGFLLWSDDRILLYDLGQDKPTVGATLPHAGRVDVLAFHPDGQHLAVAGGDNQEVTLWDLGPPPKKSTLLLGAGRGIWNVALSKDGRYLKFKTRRDPEAKHPNQRGQGDGTIFDLEKRRWSTTPDDFIPSPRPEKPGSWKVKPDSNPYIWYVVCPDKNIKHWLPLDSERDGMPRCYAFLPRAEGQPVRLAVGHYNGVSVFEVTEARAKRIWLGMGHEGEVMSLAVSDKGDWLVSASDDQTISAWSLLGRSELGARLEIEGECLLVKHVDLFSPAWESGLVVEDRIVGLWEGDKVIFHHPSAGNAARTGSVEKCLQKLKNPEPGQALILEVERGDGKGIQLFTTVHRRPLWRFFPTPDKEWVLWMWGHHYYDTSNNGDRYIGWQLNNRDDVKKTPSFYRAEQFRKPFYKPVVIDKLLENRDIRQALDESGADLKKPPKFGDFDSVIVRIDPTQQQVKDTDVKVNLQIEPRIENPNYAPKRAELWVNDHRLKVWKLNGEAFRATWTIQQEKLRDGDNDVVLQCYNQVEGGDEGRLEAPARVRFNRDRAAIQCNLHGLVVGINDYSRSRPNARGKPLLGNLHTAFRDMEAIRKAWLSQQGGELYAKVDIDLLPKKDGKVDRETILKSLQGLAAKVGPNDCVFVFLSGHGVLLGPKGQETFAFCCPDFDLHEANTTSISARELYEALADIPCRKVVFLDVCHSGEVVRPVRDLTPGGRGPIILAACDSGESSYEPLEPKEGKDRQHSYFVAALLEAMGEGFPCADRDGNDLLDAREIHQYLLDRLPELMKADKVTQTPTCSSLHLESNALLSRSSRTGNK